MKTKEILKGARGRIEQGWCQKASARDAQGTRVLAMCSSAVKWCAIGAIDAEMQHEDGYHNPISTIARVAGTDNVAQWNDSPDRTQEEVLAVFDKAIERWGSGLPGQRGGET